MDDRAALLRKIAWFGRHVPPHGLEALARELERLDATVIARILPKIEVLAEEPRPSGCKKLRGTADRWRIRIGDYRVIYEIDDTERIVDIIAVRHRREAYR